VIATEVIKEALREYVGDGDGADEEVLAQHDEVVALAATRKYRQQNRRLVVLLWFLIAINITAAVLVILSGT
jgi:hypothetical protein